MKNLHNFLNYSWKTPENFEWAIKLQFFLSFWLMGFEVGETILVLETEEFSSVQDHQHFTHFFINQCSIS